MSIERNARLLCEARGRLEDGHCTACEIIAAKLAAAGLTLVPVEQVARWEKMEALLAKKLTPAEIAELSDIRAAWREVVGGGK